MIRTVEQENAVVIRDLPVNGWLLGIAALIIGGIVASALIQVALGARSDQSFSWSDSRLWFFFLIPAIFIGFGVWFLCSRPITTAIIDRASGKITINYRRLVKSSLESFKFEDIGEITVRSDHIYTSHSTVYTPEIKTRYGETFDLTDSGMSRRGKAYDIVDLINKYMTPKGDEGDFKLTIINDD